MKEDLIKIIPKAKPKTPAAVNLLFWLLGILIIILIAASLFLEIRQADMKKEKAGLEKRLVMSAEERIMERNLKNISKKVNDFSRLFKEHKRFSGFVEFLKSRCQRQTRFLSLRAYSSDLTANLTGETESFKTLAEQITSLKAVKGVSNFKVSSVVLNRRGKIDFVFLFNFPEDIIKP